MCRVVDPSPALDGLVGRGVHQHHSQVRQEEDAYPQVVVRLRQMRARACKELMRRQCLPTTNNHLSTAASSNSTVPSRPSIYRKVGPLARVPHNATAEAVTSASTTAASFGEQFARLERRLKYGAE